MAKAIRCDRCLKFFQVDKDNRYWAIRLGRTHIVDGIFGENNISKFDICPECQEKFKKWFSEEASIEWKNGN